MDYEKKNRIKDAYTKKECHERKDSSSKKKQYRKKVKRGKSCILKENSYMLTRHEKKMKKDSPNPKIRQKKEMA